MDGVICLVIEDGGKIRISVVVLVLVVSIQEEEKKKRKKRKIDLDSKCRVSMIELFIRIHDELRFVTFPLCNLPSK